MNRRIHFIPVIFITTFFVISGRSVLSETIPFPAALDDAAIHVDRMDDILDDALIIGNGDINALVFRPDQSIVIHLTKNDVWDARLDTSSDPPIPTLDLIKRLGKSDTAFPIKDSNSGSVLPEGVKYSGPDSYHAKPYPCPRQCARIRLGQASKEESGAGSKTQGRIDLRRAAATVTGPEKNTPLVTLRALAQKNVFLIEFQGPIELLPVESKDIPVAETGTRDGILWLKQEIPGDLDWPGMEFAVAVASKGTMKAVSIVTSLESDNAVDDAITLAKETLRSDSKTLIETHESEWRQFWSKSGIEMDDRALQRNWYRSLYFLRCVSKKGVQAAGLFAGLVNDTPAWHGDYHTNYNLQQTFWSAYSSNHCELAEPYDRLMADYLPRAKWLCKQVYSMEGAFYPHVIFAYEPSDPAACKNPNGRQYIHHTWGMTVGVNGFSVQPLWWRYKYDPDPKRLEKIVYPAIRATALFYVEFIEDCEGEATVRFGPSVSPEHWGWTKHLDRNYNCTFDIALARYTLNAAIEAARILKCDEALSKRIDDALRRLPPYPLYGESDPIVVDVEGAPPITYNISVPATPVFPGDVVTWWSPDKEKELFVRTIDQLKWNGNNSAVMMAISRARLSMSGTQDWLRTEIVERTRPNATMTLNRIEPHHGFNDYGHYTEQFGTAMAVSELILQSVGDILRVFPAVNEGCRVRFANLRTQGGFLVSGEGKGNEVERLSVHCPYGGTLRLLSPWEKTAAARDGERSFRNVQPARDGIIRLETEAGETWKFRQG